MRWHVVCLFSYHQITGPVANMNREMGVGNTFGATVLSSYSGLWISLAITFTPGGFNVMAAYEKAGNGPGMFYDAFGLYLFVSCLLS